MESLNCDLSQERNCLLLLVVTQTIPVIYSRTERCGVQFSTKTMYKYMKMAASDCFGWLFGDTKVPPYTETVLHRRPSHVIRS